MFVTVDESNFPLIKVKFGTKINNYDDLKIKEAEYILGFTCIADGKGIRDGKVVDQKVATIFTGKSNLLVS